MKKLVRLGWRLVLGAGIVRLIVVLMPRLGVQLSNVLLVKLGDVDRLSDDAVEAHHLGCYLVDINGGPIVVDSRSRLGDNREVDLRVVRLDKDEGVKSSASRR